MFCTFDPFSDGRHLYTFENRCSENPSLLLGDETVKLFLNTKGVLEDIDIKMKEFLTYVGNSTDALASQATSGLIREIHKKVIEVKQSKEMDVEYMTLLQRDRENIELGREEGLEEGARKMAALTEFLLSENRSNDLKQAIQDNEFRKLLFQKYKI